MSRLPRFLKLRRDALERRDAVSCLVAHSLRPSATVRVHAVSAFAFKNDELSFARELLRRKSQLWLFRSNQRAFCGDFLVVDVSSPRPTRRPAFVLDLKQGAPLRLGGGGCGVQLKAAAHAVAELARRTGVMDPDREAELVTGDATEVLRFFGASS